MVSNHQGVWNETEANLRVVVESPPWQTWFAYFLYALGSLILFASVAMAFAKKKREQIKLKNSEEKYRILVENLPQRIFHKDRESNYISCNKNYATDLGVEPEEVVGKDDFSFFPAQLAEKYRENDQSVLLNSKTIEFEETFIKNDEELIIHMIKSPVINDTGKVTGILGIFWGITKSKLAEKEQRKLEEQLRQSQKMDSLGRLAGGVAHDFNNMLGGIIGAAELMAAELEPESLCNKYISIILHASEKAADLVSKLLLFSRENVCRDTSINVHECIANAISILERSIDKSITIETKLDALSSVVKGDASQLENALLNMGINARDAMPSGGTLSFCTENISLDQTFCNVSHFNIEPGSYIQLSVRDTGIGISFENQSRIFEPFFTTKSEGKGTGLGLAAVFGTVRQHMGAIALYSEEGEGTVFHIYLPVISVSQTEAPELELVNNGSVLRVGGILVVDDEEVIRNTACLLFEKYGYKTFTASDGKEGVKVYMENRGAIDIVLLDMIMPNMNGQTTYYRWREIDSNARVILSSGFTKSSSIDKLQRDGVFAFIKKPYKQKELLKMVQQAMAS